MVLGATEFQPFEIPTQPCIPESVFAYPSHPAEVATAGVAASEVVAGIWTTALLPSRLRSTKNPQAYLDQEQFLCTNNEDETVGVATFNGGCVQAVLAIAEAVSERHDFLFDRRKVTQAVVKSLLQSGDELAHDIEGTDDRAEVQQAVQDAILQARAEVPRVPFDSYQQSGAIALTCAISKEATTGDVYAYVAGVGTAQALVLAELPDGELSIQKLFLPQDGFYFEASMTARFWELSMAEKSRLRDEVITDRIKQWKNQALAQVIAYQRKLAVYLSHAAKIPKADSIRINLTKCYPEAVQMALLVGTNSVANMIPHEQLKKVWGEAGSPECFSRALHDHMVAEELSGTFAVAALK